MNTTILDIRPGLSGQLDRAREALPADARRTLDEHVTQAERLVEDVFGGVPVWTLRGSDALWIRAADLAEVMEATVQTVSHQTKLAEATGEISNADVRRNVRDEDVNFNFNLKLKLTDSPAGVLTLTLRAARLLVMSCRGERGVRFRAGLDRLLETASATERLLVALLLDRSTATLDARALRSTNAAARMLVQCGDREGARVLLRRAYGLRAPEAAPASEPAEDAALQLVRETIAAGGPDVVRHHRGTGLQPAALLALLRSRGIDPSEQIAAWTRRGVLVANHGSQMEVRVKGQRHRFYAFAC